MASLSIAGPVLHGTSANNYAPAVETGARLPFLVWIDADGTIRAAQSQDGHSPVTDPKVAAGSSYFVFLEGICGTNPKRLAAIQQGILAVAAGYISTFSVELPCKWSDREVRMRLDAAPDLQSSDGSVVLTHTGAGVQDDPQVCKLEALGRLAGGVAHDFANLVTLVSGYSDILLNRIGPQDPIRPEWEEIRKAAARGAGVTAQILDYIRKPNTPRAVVQLNALVAEMMALLRPIIGEHIRLSVSLDPALEVVEADFAQLTRVVMNLVLNARDAMPQGGSIRIRTSNVDLRAEPWHPLPPGRYVMLEVSDTGAGMDRETLRQIFQPFFTTKGRAGTGLGLSTVSRIVNQAGGAVWTRTEPGRGTSFTVCLPRASKGGEQTGPQSPPQRAAAGTETILLAEDEESVRKLLRHLLDAGGYRVLEAADGLEALRLLEHHAGAIDLLLTDVIMPGLNGRELAQRAMASKPGLKVVYMSGYTDDVLSAAGALGPGTSFLRKPLQLDILSRHIREVLDAPPVQ